MKGLLSKMSKEDQELYKTAIGFAILFVSACYGISLLLSAIGDLIK